MHERQALFDQRRFEKREVLYPKMLAYVDSREVSAGRGYSLLPFGRLAPSIEESGEQLQLLAVELQVYGSAPVRLLFAHWQYVFATDTRAKFMEIAIEALTQIDPKFRPQLKEARRIKEATEEHVSSTARRLAAHIEEELIGSEASKKRGIWRLLHRREKHLRYDEISIEASLDRLGTILDAEVEKHGERDSRLPIDPEWAAEILVQGYSAKELREGAQQSSQAVGETAEALPERDSTKPVTSEQ